MTVLLMMLLSCVNDAPTPPGRARDLISVPPGFQVSLFAAEPDVKQPIAMTFDDRGRLWVAECHTYADRVKNFDLNQSDRLIILEDVDNDGRFDKRTVFWDKGKKLTSVVTGFGGVFVTCAPQLLFIPDKDGDDKPDGEPIVLLDGFEDNVIRHNLVNGLTWGPDGWLYGRHGIQATSHVGKPGCAPQDRIKLNCCIWRFHPVTHKFEVVCWGGTNSWGLDFNEFGEGFFINTVIGHLWHMIPGAHFKRMHGDDLDPHVYGLIDQHADHYHWDTGKKWMDSRAGQDDLGGGHAHSGLMIYQGANWPDEYRGSFYTLNFHGRRVNRDTLHRHGSGYVGKHAKDFLTSADPWFRGIELISGPDGGVYILDWSDTGECHENDGVHRESGRIYKVTHGKPRPPEFADISRLTDEELLPLLAHRDEYYARKTRRLLHERAVSGSLSAMVKPWLTRQLFESQAPVHRVRCLLALHATGGATRELLVKLLADRGENVRAWAVRLLLEGGELDAQTKHVLRVSMIQEDNNLVLLHYVSSLQRVPVRSRGGLMLAALSRRKPFTDDHNLPLMTWYALKDVIAAEPEKANWYSFTQSSYILKRFSARRLAEEIDRRPELLAAHILTYRGDPDPNGLTEGLSGILDALRGRRRLPQPPGWADAVALVSTTATPAASEKIRQLGAIFGDGLAVDDLRKIVADDKADGPGRIQALRSLIDANPPDLGKTLAGLINDKSVSVTAIRGLANCDLSDTAKLLLNRYVWANVDERAEIISTLSTKPKWAAALLKAAADGRVKAADIPATAARQIRRHNDAALHEQLTRIWGELRDTPEAKLQQITALRKRLQPDVLAKSDLLNGKKLYEQHCANCHKLYSKGQAVGPELTGSDRGNLNYLLENLVDPSATVAADFRVSVINLSSGRVILGVVVRRTDKTIEVQTDKERLTLDAADVDTVEATTQSLMPENLLVPLNETEVRDLIAYLMHPRPVP